MLLVAIGVYFLLACLIGWLLFFPAGRTLAMATATKLEARLNAWFSALRQIRIRLPVVKPTLAGAAPPLPTTATPARRHYLLWLAGGLLLAVPPALVFMSGGKNMLGGYEVSTRETNQQVAALLHGEQLAPPAALPPDVFATVEVVQERPMLRSASRDWELMDAEFTQRLLMVFKIMKEQHGYDMAILEGYRSPERQDALARMGGHVTNARAGQSWHQHGLAADCAFVRNGKLVISEKDPWAMRGYELYGQVAESVGLTWGGRWKMMDFGHTELRVPGVMQRARSKS